MAKNENQAVFVCVLTYLLLGMTGAEDVSTSSCAEYVNGPDETEIVGPSVFITFNGTQTLTLTCNSTANPTPDYQWLGKDCENGNTENTCRYTPNRTDDGKSVVCAASNRKFSPNPVRSDPYYFNLLYPAIVKTFVLNGSHDSLTVTESEGSNVTIQCDARGRPGPTLLLSRTSHDGTVNLTDVDEGSEGVTDNALEHNITMAQWTDMGNYTCIVWNGVGVEDSKAITLNVASKPRPASEDSKGRDRNTPLNMTDKGIQIDLKVYPDPDKFTFTHYKGDSDQTGEDVSEKNMFTSHVTNSGLGNNFIMCFIKGKDVPEPYMGIYKVSISNDFGSIDYYFAVKERTVPEDDVVTASNHTAIIVGDQMPAYGRQRTPESSENEYTNQAFTPTTDNDSGMGMNGHSSPAEMSAVNLEFNAVPRELGGAGYACVGDFPPPRQKGGESTKKSGRAAAYEVTSIAPTGKVNIKPAAPQPNAWDIKKGDMTLADAPGGPPTLHNVGPKSDEYAMVSNPKNKTTITVGPKGDVYSTVVKYHKGDNTQGSPAKAQGKQGDVTSSSGDAAATVSPVQNTSSPGDGTDTYDHFQRDGHDPKCTSQVPDVQYSHIGNY
ncbi:hypothetical protein BaRGS_00030427 [Batillaria attramentaria]|uniref:Ig-like domain-containing protein n=1 Tax=Batillaria attramentaria TaxID=370345 RepID=A0ABD0JTW4_9CAEN